MLTKNDLIILLTEMQEQGVEVSSLIRKVITSSDIPMDVLKTINDSRPMDISRFYEGLRSKYNHKKSDLYINIVKEVTDPNEVLTTLASFNLQALLYAKKLDDPQMFCKQARLAEITKCLYNYYTTYNLMPCVNIIKLIKADMKAFESIR